MKSIKVQASPDEVKAVLKHIDRNDNGYLDFAEFSKVFRPDMSERLVNIPQNDRHLPNLAPSKEVNEDNRAHHKQMLETMNEFKKTFKPAEYKDRKCNILQIDSIILFLSTVELKVPSRFSAKPDFGSTFVNFQHPGRCPGYLEENARFKGTANGFMKEKKERMEGTRSSIGVKQFSGPLQKENCLNTKVAFQAEEKAKADARRAARLSVKR